MRVSHFSILVLLPALVATAQKEIKTQAQLDRFIGPVHSVSTQVVITLLRWTQPEGLSLVSSIGCKDCEYDFVGNRIRSGEKRPDGTFLGEYVDIVRDGQGKVIQRNRINATNGEVLVQEKDGPFGPVEEIYGRGAIVRSTKTYDRLGNLADWLSFDRLGRQVSRSVTRTNPNGHWTERSTWGKESQLQYRETYDPETDFHSFESYDHSGAVCVTFTFSHDKVHTFWEASDEPHQFGASFTTDLGNGKFKKFSCRKDGTCDVTHVTYTYVANSANQFPVTAEWRDDSGNLQYASWCEYEFDAHHNWTKRTVWILSPDVPQRTLYESDTRLITYWTK